MYQALDLGVPLSQGDIFDNCPIHRVVATRLGAADGIDTERARARILVLTQACNVENAKSTRLVVAPVYAAQHLVDQGILRSALVKEHIRRGLVYGWYFLPAAPAPIALDESVVDLRELHTVPREILEQLIRDQSRACRIMTPYREHLAQHFAVTYSRIALPEPYETKP